MDGKRLFKNVIMVGCLLGHCISANAYPMGVEEAYARIFKEINAEDLKKYFNEGGNVNERIFDGTPLSYAASKGRLDLVRLFLNLGADPDLVYDDYAHTPLVAAILQGDYEMVELLLDHGADCEKRSGIHMPIGVAVRFASQKDSKVGHEIVSLLLDRGADPNPCLDPPLHAAAIHGASLEVMETLINEGADIDGQDECGRTPLHEAADNGNYCQVATLLDWKASVTALDKGGMTPLGSAYCGRNRIRNQMKRECSQNLLVKNQINLKYKRTIESLREHGAKVE